MTFKCFSSEKIYFVKYFPVSQFWPSMLAWVYACVVSVDQHQNFQLYFCKRQERREYSKKAKLLGSCWQQSYNSKKQGKNHTRKLCLNMNASCFLRNFHSGWRKTNGTSDEACGVTHKRYNAEFYQKYKECCKLCRYIYARWKLKEEVNT